MAAGYLLKEADYIDRPLSDDEIWSFFAYLFSSKSVNDTSYKYGFLKSILDNLYNTDNNLALSFDQLFSKFTEIYWNFVLACPECNNKKRDKLAREDYLNKISKRNEIMIEKITVNRAEAAGRIKKIFDWAMKNGYNEIWTPKTSDTGIRDGG